MPIYVGKASFILAKLQQMLHLGIICKQVCHSALGLQFILQSNITETQNTQMSLTILTTYKTINYNGTKIL